MADPPKPPPQRRFKTRAGIHRKTAEERAASIRAEAFRQANETQPDSSQPRQDTARRTGSVQRDPRIRNQTTGGVFSATGAATSSRAKGTHVVSGTEEFVERAEGRGGLADVGERSRNSKAHVRDGETSAATGSRTSGRLAKGTARKDDIVYVSDDENEGKEGKAVDIEDIDRISISSGEGEEEDDDIVVSHSRRIKKPLKPSQGLRPVRAARDSLQHGERRDEALAQAKRKVKGKATSKADPDHGDKVDLDEDDEDIAVTAKQPTPIPDEKADIPPQSPTKRRRKSSTKDVKPQSETIEERAERERYTSELRKLRDELSPRNTKHLPKEEDSLADATLTTPQEGRLYLFQFPPLTPMLVKPSSQPEIKPEPTGDSPNEVINPQPSAPPSAGNPSDPQIKKEDGSGVQITGTSSAAQEPSKLLTAANIASALPSGLAGKLNVHQSGKVTLEWGADDGMTNPTTTTNLEVKWGSEVDFLQDVVLLGSGDGEGGERKAWALRQVRNKFVVVPDWGRIYE